ncbi:MAG: maleylpyruvate isomerase family mycothiol-dependent enzyme [Ilumatobacteraceae bacterium]
MDTWTSIENGREALGEYLAALAPDDWNRPSLCADWTVKDVAAHMLVIPAMSKGQVFRSFVGSGFNLDKMNAKLVGKLTAEMSTAQIAATTRASAASRGMPPGLKLPGVFNELAIHSADISEAVGKPFDLPTVDYVACLEHLKNVQPVFGAKTRIADLQLQATDTDWSTGSGPQVCGPSKQLLLAMAGRRSALDTLTGEGVAMLRSR